MERLVVRKLLQPFALQLLTRQLARHGDDGVGAGDDDGRLAAVHDVPHIVETEIGVGILTHPVERPQDIGV